MDTSSLIFQDFARHCSLYNVDWAYLSNGLNVWSKKNKTWVEAKPFVSWVNKFLNSEKAGNCCAN